MTNSERPLVAVIGAGNMGTAILKGLNNLDKYDLLVQNPKNPRVSKLADELGFELVHDNAAVVAKNPAFVILTTPAPVTLEVGKELKHLPASTFVISAAAGVPLHKLNRRITNAIVAAMIPNTPVAVNAGTIGLTMNKTVSDQEHTTVVDFLSQLGQVIEVPEDQLDIIGVVGGCGPAFVDVFMDAMSDAAVAHGMNRQTAYQVIASMVKGSGALALESKRSPAALRDEVTSPAGTTIRAVMALEKHGLRHAVIDAVNKASE